MRPEISTDIDRAVEILRSGGLVAIPTETVYGLAACALNEKAVQKIYDVKQRPRTHPLIVHLESIERAQTWGVFDNQSLSLANRFWPGPLTLLVKKKDIVPHWVTGNKDTVAIRIPDHILTLTLIEKLDEPIVAPSANRFGKVSPTSPQHVVDDLGDDVDFILDGGTCEIGVESTIVECFNNIQVLRPGAITATDITSVLQTAIAETTGSSRAPGMLTSHYAPRARVVICDSETDAMVRQQQSSHNQLTSDVIFEPVLEEFSRNLYARLRLADSRNCDVIFVVKAPEYGLGLAINDRLRKAAADY